MLYKAATLQQAHPTRPVVPVLVCRRAHQRLYWMAADLGFLVTTFTNGRQYVTATKDIEPRKITEVREGLRLPYLTVLPPNDPLPRIRQFFEETLPTRALATAARWAASARVILDYANELRTETPSSAERLDLVRQLRQEMEHHLPQAGFTNSLRSWSLPDLEDL